MTRTGLFLGAAILLAAGFASGSLFGNRGERAPASFHDMRTIPVSGLTSLVDPGDPEVRATARRLRTPEAAYAFVRDRIRYEPMAPAAPPGDILRAGAASCLGKATLLCSLYRALGIPAEQVRVVTGDILVPEGIAAHAWVDIEYRGACLQLDPSGFLEPFDFGEFPGLKFTRTFVQEEDYCFNDKGFAVVSQLNRFRDRPSGMPGAEP